MRPTIVSGVSDESRLMTEEIFGPVVCVVPFDTEEEVSKTYTDFYLRCLHNKPRNITAEM